MEVTLDLPDDTLRKVRALNILMGGSDDINALLAKMVDEAIVQKIVTTVIGSAAPAPQMLRQVSRPEPPSEFSDLTGVSDGLGDPEPARAVRRRQSPPVQAHAVADEELAHDMEVEDPGSEAKVEAPTFAAQMGDGELAPTAEEAFSMASGFQPPVAVPDSPSPRRRRAPIDKRRVSAFTGAETDRI